MVEVEYGIVKFFARDSSMNYGFLRVLDGNGLQTSEQIFFHKTDGMFVSNDDSGAIFEGRFRIISGVGCPLASPRKNDRLVFKRTAGKAGKPKACPWSYADDWDKQKTAFLTSVDDEWYHPDDEDDDCVSTGEVFSRAHSHFGNTELAREATEKHGGDFI
jgi:hypothetical protein